MEAVFGEDGKYWAKVELNPDRWQEVNDYFYCTLCDKHLNENTLVAHMDSQNHKKKVAWQSVPSAAAAAAAAPAAAAAAAPKATASAPRYALEEWMELAENGFDRRCKPCNKIIDDNHVTTTDHNNRLQSWLQHQELLRQGFPSPPEPYLAWVPWDEKDPQSRNMKCLLCNKWVQDESSHTGSAQKPSGSVDHRRKLGNYAMYAQDIAAERLKYHPHPVASRPCNQGYAAAPPTPAPWGNINVAAASAQIVQNLVAPAAPPRPSAASSSSNVAPKANGFSSLMESDDEETEV